MGIPVPRDSSMGQTEHLSTPKALWSGGESHNTCAPGLPLPQKIIYISVPFLSSVHPVLPTGLHHSTEDVMIICL